MAKRTHNVRLTDGNHELYFDNEALYAFEEVHNDTVMNVLGRGQVGFRSITNLVWAGLLHDEKLPLTQVKKIIPTKAKKLDEVMKTVVKAVEAEVGVAEEEQEKNDRA